MRDEQRDELKSEYIGVTEEVALEVIVELGLVTIHDSMGEVPFLSSDIPELINALQDVLSKYNSYQLQKSQEGDTNHV